MSGPIDQSADLLPENLVGTAKVETDNDSLVLALEDLLPDANNEVVIVSQEGHLRLNILTEMRICETGVAESHVTADGVDVNGMNFYSFEGGIRLYFTADVEITVAPPLA